MSMMVGPSGAGGPAMRPDVTGEQVARARIVASIAKHHGVHPLLALIMAHQEHRLQHGNHSATRGFIHALSQRDPGV